MPRLQDPSSGRPQNENLILSTFNREAAGLRVYLSGAGADEVYGDYGRIRAWPANLSEVWPWPSFFHQEMRDYLRKEEYVAGAWGIEGRYPFLDADLVQVGCCRRPLPSPLATTACQATAFTAVVAPPPPQPSHPILPPLQEFLSLNTTLKAQATKYPLLSYMRDAGCAPPPPGRRRHLAPSPFQHTRLCGFLSLAAATLGQQTRLPTTRSEASGSWTGSGGRSTGARRE